MSNSDVEERIRLYLKTNISWSHTKDPELKYEAKIGNDKLILRINNFPDESLYTLIVNDAPLVSFNDWPKDWKR